MRTSRSISALVVNCTLKFTTFPHQLICLLKYLVSVDQINIAMDPSDPTQSYFPVWKKSA